jgi:hypothetical protein
MAFRGLGVSISLTLFLIDDYKSLQISELFNPRSLDCEDLKVSHSEGFGGCSH